mmetsp:Transcript_97475/g.271154  ORF Transcript_97475/g.271154 Transcript_97475/m.271154 type:complete len:369 (+) Transcript_97475:43-1149(+)
MSRLYQLWTTSGGEVLRQWDAEPGLVFAAQLACLQQRSGDVACGFFCLHNAECLLRAAFADTEPAAVRALQAARDQMALEARCATWRAELLREGRARGAMAPPWSETHVASGVLERTHLDHLLQAGHVDHGSAMGRLYEAGATAMISNELPLEALNSFDVQVAGLSCTRQPGAVALVVGATIHWTVLVVVADGDGAGLQVFYCDSQNADILGCDEAKLAVMAAKCPFKSWLERGWSRSMMEDLQVDSWKGVQLVVKAARAAAAGGCNMQICAVRRWLQDGLLASWGRAGGELMLWMSDGWHVSFLETALVRVARVAVADEALRTLLRTWAEEITLAASVAEAEVCARVCAVAREIQLLASAPAGTLQS